MDDDGIIVDDEDGDEPMRSGMGMGQYGDPEDEL